MHRQVERGVGDLDRVVRDRDLARVLLGVDHRPGRRGLRKDLGRVQQVVRPELKRDAVVHAVDRVEIRALQEGPKLLPRRDQFHVDGLDVAAVDQAQVRVAGGRHEVVLASAAVGHERDHLARRARVLGVHLAPGLLLEGLHPLRLGVALPGDQVELALTLADRLLRLHVLGRRRQAAAGTSRGRPRRGGRSAHPPGNEQRQCECHDHRSALPPPPEKRLVNHVPPSLFFNCIFARFTCPGRVRRLGTYPECLVGVPRDPDSPAACLERFGRGRRRGSGARRRAGRPRRARHGTE